MKPKITKEIYKSADGWRVRFTHRNGKVLFVSSEAYRRRVDAEKTTDNFIAAFRFGDFGSYDPEHGHTTTKRPDSEVDETEEPVDAVQGETK